MEFLLNPRGNYQLRTNMVEPESVRRHLCRHSRTTYTIWIRRRDPDGRRGTTMCAAPMVRGVIEFDHLIRSAGFKRLSAIVMSFNTEPSRCEATCSPTSIMRSTG